MLCCENPAVRQDMNGWGGEVVLFELGRAKMRAEIWAEAASTNAMDSRRGGGG